MKLEELRTKRHAKAKAAREILSKAESEGRDLKDDERTQFDALDAEITTLDGDIRRVERVDAELRAGTAADPAEFATETDEQRAAAARADTERIEAFRQKHGREPDERELAGLSAETRVADTLNEFRRLTYGGMPQDEAEFRTAFYRYMTARSLAGDVSRDEYRVLSTATNPGGGYLVPQTFEKSLLLKARDFGIMRQLATVITTSTGEKITQPTEDTHGTAAWLATNAAYPESDEAFLNVTLDAFKAGTLMRVAEELLQDSSFDLEAYIARQFAARIGILENTAYVVGDGVGKPTGIVTSAPVGVTLPVGNTVSFATNGGRDAADYFIRLIHSVIQAYRNRGAFLLKDATMLGIRLVKDANGQYIWRPGMTESEPDTIYGKRVYTDPDMPTMAANAKAVLFGDFSAYTIRDVQGVGIQRLSELYAANGQVGFRAYHRTEGKLLNTDAVKALAMSAT